MKKNHTHAKAQTSKVLTFTAPFNNMGTKIQSSTNK